jgi:hypothetical protein
MMMYEIYRHDIAGKVCRFVHVCRQTRKGAKHTKRGFSKVTEEHEEVLEPPAEVVTQGESSAL